VDDHHLTGENPALTEVPADPAATTSELPALGLRDVRVPIWLQVLTLAWPALLQQLLNLAISFSDRLLAGRFQALEAERQLASQSALTTVNYLIFFLASYNVLVSVGSTALVARCIGAGDRDGAIHFTNQSLFLATVLGLIASVAGLVGMPALLTLLQLHGDAAHFALDFLTPLFALLVFQVIEAGGIACLVGAGDTRAGLGVLAVVAVLNIPLAWLFFHGLGPVPRFGFPGIAMGTAIAHTVGALLVLVLLARGRAGLKLRWSQWVPVWSLQRRLLRVSVPAGLDSLSVACGQLWFIGIVNRLGDAASGAHGIALYWEALGYLSGAAFGTAAMALVGQNLGARRPDRATASGWTAFGLGAATMSLMGLIFFTLAEPMFWLFCPDAGQEPIVREGVPVLRLVAFAMPPLAACIIFTAALRGAGDTRVPVLFTWLGFFVVRIPLAYYLTLPSIDLGSLGVIPGANLGLIGAWLAMSADILLRGVFFTARFASGRWRTIPV
jgi:putative MATE family efflux protein